MSKKSKAKRIRAEHGLYARNFPKPLRWRLDYDYLDRLSPSERRWLAEFTDRWVGGDFRDSDPAEWPKPARSQVNRDKAASKTDIYGLAECSGNLVFDDVEPAVGERIATPVPAYLDAEEYKHARDEYRKHLSQTRANRPPVESLPLYRAKGRLDRAVKRGLKEANEKRQREGQAANDDSESPTPAAAPDTDRSA